jgi:hypothetical protein
VQQEVSCEMPTSFVTINDNYVDLASLIVREQLSKAAVRLAHFLNSALVKPK